MMTPAEKLETASWLREQAEKIRYVKKLGDIVEKLETEADRLEHEAKGKSIHSYAPHQWSEMKRKMGFGGTEEEFEDALKNSVNSLNLIP